MGTDDVIRVAGHRPAQTALPEDLMDALSDELTIQLTTGYGLTCGDVDRAVTAAIDWLREHPAELARLLGWEYRDRFGAKFDVAGETANVFRQHTIEGPLRPGTEDDVQAFAAHAAFGYSVRAYS